MARGFSAPRSSRGGGFSSHGGGSRRSYSGGGGSSRGGGSYTPRPRRPIFIPMFGRRVVITTGLQTLLSFVLLLMIGSCFVFFSMFGSVSDCRSRISDRKTEIASYEEYSPLYAEIIDKATESGPVYFKTTGEFDKNNVVLYYYDDIFDDFSSMQTGVYKVLERNGQTYFMIVYTYQTADGQKKDYTVAQFTSYAYQDLNGEIEIAYAKLNGEYWAINTSYTLDKNMEYLETKDILASNQKSLKILIAMIVGSGLVFVGMIAIIVFVVVKQYKKAKVQENFDNQKAQAEVDIAQAKAEIAQKEASQKGRVCEYCGADVPDGDETCPACGSRQFK